MADLGFDVSNPQTPNAGPVIYISTDADKWGRLTVTLKNTRTDNSDIKLDKSGVLQIYFPMLTLADVKRIKVPDNSAWAGGPDATGGHLELHPKSTITISSQSSTSLELHDVLGETPRQGKFRFYYPSLKISKVPIQGRVERPPGGAGKQWGLVCTLDPRDEYQNQGDTIYVTASGKPEIRNYLHVHLSRTAGGTLPSKGTPQLSFSFLTGDDDLALCSEDRLKKVTARIHRQHPQGRWKEPAPDEQSEDVVWTVQASGGGGDLFDGESLLILRFDHIVIDLPPGGSGVLYIQYAGLTDYDDGYIQMQVTKSKPTPYVRYFHAKANGQIIGAGATVDFVPLMLEWDVFAADGCQLHSDSEPDPKPVDVPGNKPLVARPSQTYTLRPQSGGEILPGTDVHFLVTPPVASLGYGGIAETGRVSLDWHCLAEAQDISAQFYVDGRLLVEYGLSERWEYGGRDMSGTAQTYSDDNIRGSGVYEIKCSGENPGRGAFGATMHITKDPILQWHCGNGHHCVLYQGDTKIADGLPLMGERPAIADTAYRIECIGAGSTSEVATTRSAGVAVQFDVEFGFPMDTVGMVWSLDGPGKMHSVEAGGSTVGSSNKGEYRDSPPHPKYSLSFDVADLIRDFNVRLTIMRPV
jgi:hypothetical protein